MKQLWVDVLERKYYLIAEDVRLMDGEITLLSTNGQTRQVTLNGITAYQISEAEAQAYISTQLTTFLADARHQLTDVFDDLATVLRGESVLSDESDSTAVDLFAQLVGVAPETLARNPQIAQTGVQELVGELATVLEAAFSVEDDRMPYANAQARGLSAQLEAAGLAVDNERLEVLPSKLHAWYNNSDEQAEFDGVVTMLQAFASAEQPSVTDWESLIAHWSRLVQDVAEESQARDQARHYNRARQKVRDNIKTPKFDFKQVLADYRQNKSK